MLRRMLTYADDADDVCHNALLTEFQVWTSVASYNAGALLTGNLCRNPTNGNSSTATLNGTTITGSGGLGNGTNGSGSGGDGGGVYGSDVSDIYSAYLSYSSSVLTYGIGNENQGGIILVKFIV